MPLKTNFIKILSWQNVNCDANNRILGHMMPPIRKKLLEVSIHLSGNLSDFDILLSSDLYFFTFKERDSINEVTFDQQFTLFVFKKHKSCKISATK